ncbi:MAG: acyl carrier protein [Clostridia bacterium]|jgi:acyl carrier protein|nr:acyl carrier protein [Clostridia bacterium]
MLETIKAILVKHLKIDPNTITENTNLQEDLGADSLDLVEIIMEFETKFGLEIPDEDILKFKTIGDAVKYIEAHK